MSDHYAVEIQIHDFRGKTYQVYYDPEFEEDVVDDLSANISCTPEDVLMVSSVQDLLALLKESAHGYGAATFDSFIKEVEENIKSIDEISSIKLKRIYEAYKEAADPWLTYLDVFDEHSFFLNEGKNKFYNYILQYRKAEGDEKKRVCSEFQQFMEHAEDFSIVTCDDKQWPTGFMGTDPTVSIDWRGVSKDLENAVRRISDMQFYIFQSYCVETVTIDLKSKLVTSEAQFIFQDI